ASNDLPHDLDRARRAGHDAGSQRVEMVAREGMMLELSDEHGRHTIKRSAALFLNRAETGFGRKRLRRQNDGAAVRERRDVAQDTSKAMIERHGQADAIAGSVLKALSDKESVIKDVVMRERRALG